MDKVELEELNEREKERRNNEINYISLNQNVRQEDEECQLLLLCCCCCCCDKDNG